MKVHTPKRAFDYSEQPSECYYCGNVIQDSEFLDSVLVNVNQKNFSWTLNPAHNCCYRAIKHDSRTAKHIAIDVGYLTENQIIALQLKYL